MFGIGLQELLIVGVISLFLFGSHFPQIMRRLGDGTRQDVWHLPPDRWRATSQQQLANDLRVLLIVIFSALVLAGIVAAVARI
jgi:hypothetical protein